MVSTDLNSTGYKKIPRKFLIVGFSMALFTSLCIILILWAQIGVYSRDLNRIRKTEWSRSNEIEGMKKRIVDLENQIEELVKSRLPGLKELAFDQVIAIDRHHVKNIVFTVIGKNGQKRYEYKTVFENKEPKSIEPKADLFFFDHLGIQISQATIDDTLTGSDRGLLEPGEIRSYYNQIQFLESQLPRYFRIKVKKP